MNTRHPDLGPENEWPIEQPNNQSSDSGGCSDVLFVVTYTNRNVELERIKPDRVTDKCFYLNGSRYAKFRDDGYSGRLVYSDFDSAREKAEHKIKQRILSVQKMLESLNNSYARMPDVPRKVRDAKNII